MPGTLHASTIEADRDLKGDRVTSVTARRQPVTLDRLVDRERITFASRQAGDGGAMEWEYPMLTTRRT